MTSSLAGFFSSLIVDSRATKHKCFLCCRFQAVYNYVPRNEDELELREGDVVDVVEKCDDGWFVGVTCYINLL